MNKVFPVIGLALACSSSVVCAQMVSATPTPAAPPPPVTSILPNDPRAIDPATGFRQSWAEYEAAKTTPPPPPPSGNPVVPSPYAPAPVQTAPTELVDPQQARRLFLFRDRRALEAELTMAIHTSCQTTRVIIEVQPDAFLADPKAQEKLPIYAKVLPASFADICRDNRSRVAVDRLLSKVRLVHNPKATMADAVGDGYGITVTYNFNHPKPIEVRQFTPRLHAALERLVRQHIARTQKPKSFEQQQQDEQDQ